MRGAYGTLDLSLESKYHIRNNRYEMSSALNKIAFWLLYLHQWASREPVWFDRHTVPVELSADKP